MKKIIYPLTINLRYIEKKIYLEEHIKEKSIQLLNGSHWGTGDRFERKIEIDKKHNLNPDDSLSKIGIFEWQDLSIIHSGMKYK